MFNYHTRWRGRDKQKKINKTLWNKRGKKKIKQVSPKHRDLESSLSL